MTTRYDTPNDVSMRLDATICRYKGIPVYLRHYEALTLMAYDMQHPGSTNEVKVQANDTELDIESPPCGYFMSGNKLLFLERLTLRRQHQGLSSRNTTIKVDTMDEFPTASGTLDRAEYWPGIRDSILGIFPSFETSIAAVRESPKIYRALSRRYAIGQNATGTVVLRYCGRTIGAFTSDDRCVVSEDYRDSLYAKKLHSIVQVA